MLHFDNATDRAIYYAIQDGKYKTRCRIYSVNQSHYSIDMGDETQVTNVGNLLQYKYSDHDSNKRIGQNGIEIVDYFIKGSERYGIGYVTSKRLNISFINDDGGMSSFHWDWPAVVYLDIFVASIGWKSIPLGVFLWEHPFSTNGKLIEATANDYMSVYDDVIDAEFNDTIDWSQGVSLYDLVYFLFDGVNVKVDPAYATLLQRTYTERPFVASGMTRRDLLAKVAEICGLNARLTQKNRLVFRTLNPQFIDPSHTQEYIYRTDTIPCPIKKFDLSDETALFPAYVEVNSSQIGAAGSYPSGRTDLPLNVIDNGFAYKASDLDGIAEDIYDTFNYEGLDPFHYGTVDFLDYDWRTEAGDVIYLGHYDSGYQTVIEDYEIPVYLQTIKWAGGSVRATVTNWGQHFWQSAPKEEREKQDISYRIYEASQSGGRRGGGADPATVPASASIDANGLITFYNSGGTALFTLQLPN